MQTVKERIVEQAKILFNEKGYYQVTMRDIAKAVGTTLGNLTYHFPRKEELVIEIQKAAHTNLLYVLEQRLEERETHVYSLAEIYYTFRAIEHNEKEYSYYFNNVIELGRDYPEINKMQQYIRSVFIRYFHTALLTLQLEDIFRGDISSERYYSLARAIVLLMTSWNQKGSPTVDSIFTNYSFSQTCFDLIYPFLTEKGRNEYQNIFKK